MGYVLTLSQARSVLANTTSNDSCPNVLRQVKQRSGSFSVMMLQKSPRTIRKTPAVTVASFGEKRIAMAG